MKTIVFFLLFLSILICNNSLAQTKSKTQKTETTKSSASNKVTCIYCKGTGKGIFPVACPNCINWSAEYKRKVPCHVCKDTRVVYQKKCPMCDGTGKLDKDWYKFGMSDKELDTAMKQASKYKKEMPAPGQVITDDQAWKMFNEYANPELKQNGYGEVRQTVMDDHPMRPKESTVQYVDNPLKIEKEKEDEKNRLEAEAKKTKAEKERYDKNIRLLKSFFGEGFDYQPFGGDYYGVVVVSKPGLSSIFLSDFEIAGDFLVNKSSSNEVLEIRRIDGKGIYNREGKLLYGGDMSPQFFFGEENGTKATYLYLKGYDKETGLAKLIANSEGQVIVIAKDFLPSPTGIKKNELLAVLSPNKLPEFDSCLQDTTAKIRYVALKILPSNITDLESINYEYEIFDLKTWKQIRNVNESNLKSYLEKLFTSNNIDKSDATRGGRNKKNSLIDGFREDVKN